MEFSDTLKKNYEFRRLYAKGKSAVNPFMALYARKVRRPGNRIGFTVSNKLGNAVTRNRVRRRLRELYRLHEREFRGGLELVVVARTRAVGADYARLEQAFLSACRKLDLLRQRAETARPEEERTE